MKLITAHRILIAAGIVFFGLFALLQIRRYVVSDVGATPLVVAIVSGAIAIALVVYFRSLRSWGQR